MHWEPISTSGIAIRTHFTEIKEISGFFNALISVNFQMCVIIMMKRTYFIWVKAFLIENILCWNQVWVMMTLKL